MTECLYAPSVTCPIEAKECVELKIRPMAGFLSLSQFKEFVEKENIGGDIIACQNATKDVVFNAEAEKTEKGNVTPGTGLRILGLVNTPDNSFAEHADLEVMFNEHIYEERKN